MFLLFAHVQNIDTNYVAQIVVRFARVALQMSSIALVPHD